MRVPHLWPFTLAALFMVLPLKPMDSEWDIVVPEVRLYPDSLPNQAAYVSN